MTHAKSGTCWFCEKPCEEFWYWHIECKNDFIEKLIHKARFNNEKIGIFTGKVLSQDGKKIDSCGQLLSRSRKPIERGYGRHEIQYTKNAKLSLELAVQPACLKEIC